MVRSEILAGKAVLVFEGRNLVSGTLRSLRSEIRRFAYDMGRIGAGLLGPGAAGTAGLLFGGTFFKNFSDQMLFLQTKIRETGPAWESLTQQIRYLGETTSFTATEVAEAAVELARMGLTADETSKSLKAVLDLARAGQISTAAAAQQITRAMRVWNIPFEEAERVASVLVVAADNAATSVELLQESMKEVQGQAANLRISLPELASIIGVLADASLIGTKAGTNFNTALGNVVKNVDKLRAIPGVEPFDEGYFIGILPLLKQISEATRGMNEEAFTAFIGGAFNIRGARAMFPLVRPEFLERLEESMQRTASATDEVAKKAKLMDSAFGGALRMLKSVVQELDLALFSQFEKELTAITDALRTFIKVLTEAIRKFPALGAAIMITPPAVAALGIGMIAMVPPLLLVAAAITPVIKGIELLRGTTLAWIGAHKQFLPTIAGPATVLKAQEKAFKDTTKVQIDELTKQRQAARRSGDKIGYVMLGLHKKHLMDRRKATISSFEETGKRLAGGGLGTRIATGMGIMAPGMGQKLGGLRSMFRMPDFLKTPMGWADWPKLLGTIARRVIILVKSIPKMFAYVDIGKKAALAFKNIAIFAGNFLTIVRNIGRVAFSSTGLFLLIDALLIFGTKVPIFGDALRLMRDGFKEAGNVLRNQLLPDLKLAGQFLQRFYDLLKGGDFEKAMELLKGSFADIVKLIRVDLSIAWMKFLSQVQPLTDLLVTIGTSLMRIGDALGRAIERIFGPILDGFRKGFEGLFGGGDILTFMKDMIAALTDLIVGSIDALSKAISMLSLIIGKLIEALGLFAQIMVQVARTLSLLPGNQGEQRRVLGEFTDPKKASMFHRRHPGSFFKRLQVGEAPPIYLVLAPSAIERLERVAGPLETLDETMRKRIARDEKIINLEETGNKLRAKLNGFMERLNKSIISDEYLKAMKELVDMRPSLRDIYPIPFAGFGGMFSGGPGMQRINPLSATATLIGNITEVSEAIAMRSRGIEEQQLTELKTQTGFLDEISQSIREIGTID